MNAFMKPWPDPNDVLEREAAGSAGAETERMCQVDGCGRPHQWFTDPGLYLCDEHSYRWIERFPVVAQGEPPQALDAQIEQMAREWPDWTFMVGHEVYDPIPDSPGETNHRELVGKMIWWATARTHDSFDHLIIKSAERQPSLESAIRHLRSQLPALTPSEATD